MSEFFKRVVQFQIAGGTIDPAMDKFDAKQVGFYTGMQCEELAEKLRAIFEDSMNPWFLSLIEDVDKLGRYLKRGHYTDRIDRANRIDLLDADIDLQVVTEGSLAAQGVDRDGAREEVCRSNEDKIVDGKVIRDPVTGKILKPEGWRPPHLAPYVAGDWK